jgi:hypothetical protein
MLVMFSTLLIVRIYRVQTEVELLILISTVGLLHCDSKIRWLAHHKFITQQVGTRIFLSFIVDNPRRFLETTPQRIMDTRTYPPIASKTAKRPLFKTGIPSLQIHQAGELQNQKFPNPLPTLGPFFPSSLPFTHPISRALVSHPTFQKFLEPRASSPNPVKDAFLRLVASRARDRRHGRRRWRGWRLERREVPYSAGELGPRIELGGGRR